ncbi:MAG: alcohol dehydrogenase catalytic domain-containing protein [Armatimonadia bacterium]|nr:alcohol dehydrogenase catalytic domain-containing protein [Armatimonadia bacterium]
MGEMLAAVLEAPRQLTVRSIPVPEPAPGEAICEVAACGICGSDLRYLEGENPWAKHTLGYEKPNPPDMILGHEVAGFVEVGGERVRAGVLAFRTCGECPECLRGESQLCTHTEHLGHGAGWEDREFNPGGMAEYMPVWRENLHELPESVSFDEATFLDGLGVAIHAVRRGGVRSGDRVAVLGAGPIGMLIAQAARVWGAEEVVTTDVYDAALECALELGVDAAVDGRGVRAEEVADELAGAAGGALNVIFDSTGDLGVQQAALSRLAAGGMLMLMAGSADGLRLDPASLAGERTVTTSSNNLPEDFARGLELLASGEIVVQPMVTHSFPLSEAVDAFDVAANKHQTGAIKVIIHP